MKQQNVILIALLGALFTLAACGSGATPTGAFSATFPDNDDADVSTVLGRLGASTAPAEAQVVVGLTTAPALYAYDFAAGHELWSIPVGTAVSAPVVAGGLVFLHEPSGVVARSLRDGSTRFTVQDSAMHLVGADGAGELSVMVLSTGAGVGARSEVTVAEGGQILWRRAFEQALGAPAVAGGLIFLPWATQNLSILDGHTGDELARLRSTDAVVSEAMRLGGHVYYGRDGFFALDAAATTGSRESAHFAMPTVGDLPGDPGLDPDPYRPAPSPTSAVHKIRLSWRPADVAGDVGIQDGAAYFVFYRLVFALEAEGGALRWVTSLPADALDSSASEGGLWLALADGSLRFLDAADGRTHAAPSSEHASVAMALPRDLPAPTTPADGEAPPLAEQLLAAAQNTDARLVPARTFAVAQLASLQADAGTESLVSLCDDRRLPPPVRASSCEALAGRTSGASFVLAALRRHGSFLEQTEPPPVGALARAATAMRQSAAVPLLLGQLRDPATASADLAAVAQAIGQLGDRSAAGPLMDFLRLYHADAADEPMRAALGAAAGAVTRLLGAASEEDLTEVASDPFCQPGVADSIREAISSLTTEEPDTTSETEDSPEPGETPVETHPRLPARVTVAMVTRALAPVEHELVACLSADSGHPSSARIVLVLEGDGAVRMVSTTPATVQPCLEALVRAQTFPGNRAGSRQQLIYTLRRPR